MFAELAVNAGFLARGKPGTYTPDGGSATAPILIVVDRTAENAPSDDGRPRAGQVAIDVRRSEVPAPAAKGLFTLTETGEAFRVHSKPRPQDPEGLVWTMMAVPASP